MSLIIVALLLAGAVLGWAVRQNAVRFVVIATLLAGIGAMVSGLAVIAGFLFAAFAFAFLVAATVHMMTNELRKKHT